MKYNYVIGMFGKASGTIYLAHTTAGTSPRYGTNSTSAGGTPTPRQYATYEEALAEARRCAETRSEDYDYLVLKVVASATIATKPIKIEEY